MAKVKTLQPPPHYVACACGVRWWRLCNETEDAFARRVRQFPPHAARTTPRLPEPSAATHAVWTDPAA